jgi:hypothetical protein
MARSLRRSPEAEARWLARHAATSAGKGKRPLRHSRRRPVRAGVPAKKRRPGIPWAHRQNFRFLWIYSQKNTGR